MVFPLSMSSGSDWDECFQKASFFTDGWVVPFLHPVECEASSLECLSGPIKCLGKMRLYAIMRGINPLQLHIGCCTLRQDYKHIYWKFHLEDRSKFKLIFNLSFPPCCFPIKANGFGFC